EPLLDDPEAASLYARGASANSYPGQGDYRPDLHTAELALYHLRRHRPRFMLLSLGDADKFGHANMYRNYLEALHESDKVVAQVAHVLDELAAQGWPSTLLITADHGRDRRCREHGRKYPESARAWLIARGTGIVDHGYVSAPRPRQLADIAPTLRRLLGLEADDGATAGTPLVELLSAPVDRRSAGLGL
ncbi:MAG TPA: sulfatase-like hydrolase/transferase, partial [Polyangiaceae bacterium]|nr:sulfatase-like hydrolase/transferase [Polyangiaceae bacterium]